MEAEDATCRQSEMDNGGGQPLNRVSPKLKGVTFPLSTLMLAFLAALGESVLEQTTRIAMLAGRFGKKGLALCVRKESDRCQSPQILSSRFTFVG